MKQALALFMTLGHVHHYVWSRVSIAANQCMSGPNMSYACEFRLTNLASTGIGYMLCDNHIGFESHGSCQETPRSS